MELGFTQFFEGDRMQVIFNKGLLLVVCFMAALLRSSLVSEMVCGLVVGIVLGVGVSAYVVVRMIFCGCCLLREDKFLFLF